MSLSSFLLVQTTPAINIQAILVQLGRSCDGKIDQWYSIQGRAGVAFILNVTDTAAALAMLEKLPLGQAHLMHLELIPLAPLNPLRQLQGMSSGSP